MQNKERLEDFLSHCKYERGLSQNTLKAYKLDLEQLKAFIEETDKEKKIHLLDRDGIRKYIKRLHQTGQPKTVKRKIAVVKTFYNFLETEGIIKENPFVRIKVQLRIPKKLPVYLSINEVEKILRFSHNNISNFTKKNTYAYKIFLRNRAILELLFATGMRVGELCTLKKENVDLNQWKILIHGKGNKERVIGLYHHEVQDSLLSYAETLTDSTCDYFFINQLGKRLSEQSVRNMIKKYISEAGINRHITPHHFRHTFATLLLDSDVDIRHVQELLGHSSLATTQIYTHVSSKKKGTDFKHKASSWND